MTAEKKKIDEIITKYLKEPNVSEDELLQELKKISPAKPSVDITKSATSAALNKTKAQKLLSDMKLSNKKIRALSSSK